MGLINEDSYGRNQDEQNMAEVISGGQINSTQLKSSTGKRSKKNDCRELAISSFVFSAFFLYKGFDKMYVYESAELFKKSKNVYVGGDAYNYIINGTYSTAFFVLATSFLLFGILLLIYGELKLQRK